MQAAVLWVIPAKRSYWSGVSRLFLTNRSSLSLGTPTDHGGSHLTLSMTGDPRRLSAGVETPGLIHVMNPRPWTYSFGSTDAEITRNYLVYLEEVIQEEGPSTIAAMINETVTGTNGILVPPAGLMEGLRGLCDKYGILMIQDEVMCGFGRTGKMMGGFSFRTTQSANMVWLRLLTCPAKIHSIRTLQHHPGPRDHGKGDHFFLLPSCRGRNDQENPRPFPDGQLRRRGCLSDGLGHRFVNGRR